MEMDMDSPKLPLEVSPRTTKYSLPYDFEKLVLKCEDKSFVAAPMLSNDGDLFKKPRDYVLSVTPRQAIPALVAKIANKPNIAEYILSIELERRGQGLIREEHAVEERVKYMSALTVQLRGHHSFDADTFVRHLISGTKESLEKLVLDLGPGVTVSPIQSSLRGLRYLKYLELSTKFLVDVMGPQTHRLYPRVHAELVPGRLDAAASITNRNTASDIESTVHDRDGDVAMLDCDVGNDFYDGDPIQFDDGSNVTWRLTSVLPQSLETLIIHMPAEQDHILCLKKMFRKFAAQRVVRLPRLKTIEVHAIRQPTFRRMSGPPREEVVAQLLDIFDNKNILTKLQVHDSSCRCC